MNNAVAISQLDDLELAVLVCLVAKEHCIVRAPQHLLPAVQTKLESTARDIFRLVPVLFDCDSGTDVAELQETAAKHTARDDADGEGSRSLSRGSESGRLEEFDVR